jgi:hypothetical protein
VAKLILKEFRCVVDTDESGDESPYFVTWVGNLVTAETAVKWSRKAFWENKVSPGPTWPVNDIVVSGFDLNPSRALALALMIEEDEGTDLTKAEAENDVKARMFQIFENYRQNGFQATDPLFINVMRNTLRAAVLDKMSPGVGADDDLMEEDDWRAARVIPLPGHVGAMEVTFKGGNGKYVARYHHE